MADAVDISGLDKAEVLAALYNHSRPIGMGFLQAREGEMSVEEARQCFEEGDDNALTFPSLAKRSYYFDYLRGRPLKIDLNGDKFRPALYDRDNGGPGTAERIVKELRQAKAAVA